MRHADVNPLICAVKEIELADLIAAIKAHGGIFVFDEDGKSAGPNVEYYDEYKGPRSGTLLEARLATGEDLDQEGRKREKVILTITDSEDDTYDIDAKELYLGFISGITAQIPEPKQP